MQVYPRAVGSSIQVEGAGWGDDASGQGRHGQPFSACVDTNGLVDTLLGGCSHPVGAALVPSVHKVSLVRHRCGLWGALMAGAGGAIGRKSPRVGAVAKPWWPPALTPTKGARKALPQQWEGGGRVDSLVAKARPPKAKKAYKALARKGERGPPTTSLGEAGGQGGPGRAKRLHQIFRRAAPKSRAPAGSLGHRATLDYVKPKIMCTNASQVAKAVSLPTAQVSSEAGKGGCGWGPPQRSLRFHAIHPPKHLRRRLACYKVGSPGCPGGA